MYHLCYVMSRVASENIVAAEVLGREYLNNHYDGTWQFVATKNLLFNPALLMNRNKNINVRTVV